MLDIETINKEIKRLEESVMSYTICEKLAALYTIRDHYTTNSQVKTTDVLNISTST